MAAASSRASDAECVGRDAGDQCADRVAEVAPEQLADIIVANELSEKIRNDIDLWTG
jgi:hypothetical protein